jgi:hypothetical protein
VYIHAGTKFSPGDKFRVKSNGATGKIIRVDVEYVFNKDSIISYEVWWDHHPYGTYMYTDDDLIKEWELLVEHEKKQHANSHVHLNCRNSQLPDLEYFDVTLFLPQTICAHEWITYQGFSNSFEYCEKCDAKRSS